MTLSNPAQYISGRTVQEQMNSLIDYVDQRAADVALDAIASDVAQVHQDMLDADADAAAAAASAAAAAGTLTNAVKKTGESSQTIAGDILIGNDLNVTGDVSAGGTVGFSAASAVYVPDVTTGLIDGQAANGNKVKNELDNYAPMVRTTGNQTIAGTKTLTSTVVRKTAIAPAPTGYTEANGINFSKSDDSVFAQINAAGNATANFIIIKANSRVNASHYSKLYLRVNDSGKCDLVMESSTSQGYEQHIIYSFGV